jgi:orotidine-5'-phosphate decarboxylase
MNKQELINQIKEKKSFLCIGLDTDSAKIPKHLLSLEDPVFEFNKRIIDETKDLCVAFKLNIAFYESQGINGWKSLMKTIDYIPKDIFTIADAKRGDIGNTSSMYAKTFFESMDFSSITVSPYMGSDSVEPFLKFKNKWVILLALTSNLGSQDFQKISDSNGVNLYENVIRKSAKWAGDDRMMYVVGATQSKLIKEVRKIAPNHFLLVPGIGAQGGNLSEVIENGLNSDYGLLINSSRSIIYSDSSLDFASSARNAAMQIKLEMERFIN